MVTHGKGIAHMTPRWKLHALEQLEADRDHLLDLAEKHRQLAEDSPKIMVDEYGIHYPRHIHEQFVRYFTTLSEGTQDWIDQLESGKRRHVYD